MTRNTRLNLSPLLHILGWSLLGFLLLFYVPLSWSIVMPTVFWIWQSLVLVMMITLFYINAKIMVPVTIIRAKSGWFAGWVFGALLITQLVAYAYTSQTGLHTKLAILTGKRNCTQYLFDKFIFAVTLLVLGISTSWSLLRYWQSAAQHKQELEQDKTEAELAMLKMQINPHFFFNSLNNIYSLTYINVEDSRRALLTLSRMMRYLLYTTQNENASLVQEVDFLKDYISLMRLRATGKVNIITDIPNTINDYPVAPMLLLPFIENAFKHGIDPDRETEIKIILEQDGTMLNLDVTNCAFSKNDNDTKDGGVGMVNTQRRLQLLYAQRHRLFTGLTTDGKYKVNLQINLAS